jgi:thiamine-monophosphate kinase
VARYREPVQRLQAGTMLARTGVVSAMIDISDGLLQDLRHVCNRSAVGAEVELDLIPRSARVRSEEPAVALTGGEDYELLCVVPSRHLGRLKRLMPKLGCPLSRIGRLLPREEGVRLRDGRGALVELSGAGFDHFDGLNLP